jgi:hypothetical protein
VLAVSSNTRVWTERPELQEPAEQTGGRPRRARRLAPGAPSARMVSEVVAGFPSHAWKRLAVVEGEKGPIEYHWARTRVVESRDQLPGPDIWLLARRSISDPKQIAYYLAYAPAKSSLALLAFVASQRYTVEQCIRLSSIPSPFVLSLVAVRYTSASILILCFRFSLPPCVRVKSKNLLHLLKARCSALVSHLLAVSRMSQARNAFTLPLWVINTLCPSFGLLYSDYSSEKSSFSYLSLEIKTMC